jgi:hypothetical protein
MNNSVKLTVVTVFGVLLLALFLRSVDANGLGLAGDPTPTPPAKPMANMANKPAATPPANTAANTAANAAANANTGGKVDMGGKTIPKVFTLGQDSQSEYGEAVFDHDKHAFEKYSPDGTAVMGCVECHHTDQPKSALKPPLLTSERDVVMTLAQWKSSPQKVTDCRACHFQDGNVPDGKEMPTATYNDTGKPVTKELNNQLAYHINCNTCHDAAAKARPELKKKPGFATSKDCAICHKTS